MLRLINKLVDLINGLVVLYKKNKVKREKEKTNENLKKNDSEKELQSLRDLGF